MDSMNSFLQLSRSLEDRLKGDINSSCRDGLRDLFEDLLNAGLDQMEVIYQMRLPDIECCAMVIKIIESLLKLPKQPQGFIHKVLESVQVRNLILNTILMLV